ncbi:MAG: hypothetical protein M1357_01750 [Candidatus Marsarchaeota archaeon]|nr:hypothetical protein [Candidatus Marsarchaeota archaeon]
MSFKKIISSATSREGTVDSLIKNLKADLDVPRSIQAQSKEVLDHVSVIEQKLRPDIIDGIVNRVKNKEFTPLLGKAVLPGLDELVRSFRQDIEKERHKHELVKKRMTEAVTWLSQVQVPLVDFLSQSASDYTETIVKRKKEIESFSKLLNDARLTVEKTEEKVEEVEQRLSALSSALTELTAMLADDYHQNGEVALKKVGETSPK